MLKDFKAFILRGNVVDLAIGVVIGAAFGAVVTSLVKDLLTPLLGLLQLPDFSSAALPVGDARLRYGRFLNALISMLTISAVVFFLVVKPLNRLMTKSKTGLSTTFAETDCPYCFSRIPDQATRCAFCTSELTAASSS